MRYKVMTLEDINQLAEMYVETFNAPPWNDEWTVEFAAKRLQQMINTEDSFGLIAYQGDILCGMILGSEEQFYDGILFNIKEFCVKRDLQRKGIGTTLWIELEDRLREKGVNSVVLFTSKGEETEGFYKKRGLATYDSMVMMGKKL